MSTSTSSTSKGIPIRFKTNIIVPATADRLASFVRAGDPSPYRDVSQVPEGLRAFIAQPGDELEPVADAPRSATFILGETYDMDRDRHRRSRKLQREIDLQAAQLEQAEYRQEALSAEPSAEVQAALSDASEAAAGFEIAQAQSQARQNAMAAEHARRFTEEDQTVGDDRVVSPTIEGEQNP